VAGALTAGWALEGRRGPDAATAAARERAPSGVRVERSVRYGRAPAAVMDVHLPTAWRPRARPAVIVVHGGGWRFGARRRMEGVATALAQRGLAAFNVGYTLAAPGLPGFPRQLGELTAAIRWVRRHAGRFGVDPAQVEALGSSAGAQLAALSGRGRLEAGARVRAAVAWSGPST
jgi:pectinesterase